MRIFLVDKNTLFLEGLQNLLCSYGMEVAGIASHIAEVLSESRLLEPDVIMINISGDKSRETMRDIRRIVKKNPSAHVIFFTDCRETLSEAVQNGASCYLLEDIHGEELLQKLCNLEKEIYPNIDSVAGMGNW
jgi:DNA-binding NarL/FixJ family response regulator